MVRTCTCPGSRVLRKRRPGKIQEAPPPPPRGACRKLLRPWPGVAQARGRAGGAVSAVAARSRRRSSSRRRHNRCFLTPPGMTGPRIQKRSRKWRKMSDKSRGCKEERPQGLGGWRRRSAYVAKEAYVSLRRRSLAPLGLTSTILQKGDRKRRRGMITREAARRRCLFG